MFCKHCGNELNPSAKFCKVCGTPVKNLSEAADSSIKQDEVTEKTNNSVVDSVWDVQPEKEVQPVYNVQPTESVQANDSVKDYNMSQQQGAGQPNMGYGYNIPIRNFNPAKDYTPIGMWGYFGYQLLFYIPVIGQVLVIILACGISNNVNVTNFARSQFCLIIINAIIIAIVVSICVAAGMF